MFRSLLARLMALALWSSAVATPAVAAPVVNLLKNPGFESPLVHHPWMPAAWDTFASGLPTVFFGRDTMLAHGGHYSVSVANLSNRIPMWHNWSQVIAVGKESWGKDLVFSVWSRSASVQGRGYILVQAYRDTIQRMAMTWGIDREAASERMHINKLDDPFQNLAWKRLYFSDTETEWVKREVRVYCPPLVNVIFVRCGLLGTGQIMFDDASLTYAAPRPPDPIAENVNLLADPSFERTGDDWEYSLPPYDGLIAEVDSSVAHSGKTAMHVESGVDGIVEARAGVCQSIVNRALSGKRMRVTAYVKTDSLGAVPYVIVYCSTAGGDVRESTPREISGTVDWTKITHEFDVPKNTYMVWAWFVYDAPAHGKLWWDDASLEVVGPALTAGTKPIKPLPDR
jgi:hypothetical protein